MSIYIGQATNQGKSIVIVPPLGFASVEAVRLTNYTSDVLTLGNVSGQSQSNEYLMPLQSMVYKTINIQNPPTVTGLTSVDNFALAQLLVEWSTDPLEDFIGTYPTSVSPFPNTAWYSGILTLTLANTAYVLDGFAGQHRTILAPTTNTASVGFAPTITQISTVPATYPELAPGAAFSLDTGSAVFLISTVAGQTVQWWGD